MRRRALGALAALAVVLASSALWGAPQDRALAEQTALSTVFKTGTDVQTGSSAASADAPGGAVQGTAHPGDTVKWVVSYQNNTAGSGSVDLRDALTSAGAYVPGSLQLPPNPDQTHPLQPQFSVDAGASWQPGAPPAGANGVGLTGTFPPRLQQRSVNPPAPAAVDLNNSAGDGYNAVSSADGSVVYAVFHHNNSNQYLFCATTSGGLCPGWPVGSNLTATYVSPVAGTPIGTGANGMITALQNGTFIANGRLYWPAETITSTAGSYPTGLMCLDLASLTSCGFTQLDTQIAGGGGAAYIAGTGIPASDGNRYFIDANGNVLCFNATTGACGRRNVGGVTVNGMQPWSVAYGDRVLSLIRPGPISGGSYNLYCYDVATASDCPGYPIVAATPLVGTNGGSPAALLLPLLDRQGALTGECVLNNATTYGCWDLAGSPVPDPYPAGTGFGVGFTGDILVQGAQAYVPVSSGGSVACFDFAAWSGTGTVPTCTGFTPAVNPLNYTVRPMTSNASCLLADGDGRRITSFDAFSGGRCATTSAAETVAPAQYYCGSGTTGFQAWNQFAITGAPAGSFGTAVVTLKDANGTPLPAFTDVVVTAGQTLDISAIPASGATATLTADVVFHSATSAITGAQAALSWVGETPQMCFETTVPAVGCGQSGTVSNDALAVTDATASGGGSDAPAGNRTGSAVFAVTPRADQCALTLSKSASPPVAAAGTVVTYTITVRNAGSLPYSSPTPAAFTDDLADTLTDAAYNGDAAASAGSVSYSGSVLAWTGPDAFAPGATSTITYSVTVHDPAAGPHLLRNTVVSSSAGSSCPPGGADAACTAAVPVNSLDLVKSASPNAELVAQSVLTYSFLVTNTGNQTLTGIAVTDTQASPAGALDGPIVCPQTTLAPLASTVCTATYTVTQEDVDHGSVSDTAVAHGTPPVTDGVQPPVVDSPPRSITVPSDLTAGIRLIKTVDPTSASAAGDQVTYSFLVTNIGEQTLHGVAIDETAFSGSGGTPSVTCPETTLSPLASTTCTATYTLTQADADAGRVTNTATATGLPPGGADAVTSTPGEAAVIVPAAPKLDLAKSAQPTSVTHPGDPVVYSFAVTNTGNVTVHSIAIDERSFTGNGALSAVDCPVTALAPAQTTTCTATYTVTQDDIDRGSIQNTATAAGLLPDGVTPVASAPSQSTVTAEQSTGISLIKTADRDSVERAGQVVTYTFTVTNTGTVSLLGIAIQETGFGGTGRMSAVDCADERLEPGQSTSCTATYVVTPADLTLGRITNTATVSGVPPSGGAAVDSAPATAVVAAVPPPSGTPSPTPTPAPSSSPAGSGGLPVTGGDLGLSSLLGLGALIAVLMGTSVVLTARRARR